MHILVTGGAGLIGSHLVDFLLLKGHRVIVVDNLSTGSLKNLAYAQESERCRFVCADIRDSSALEGLFDGVDWVFHLAAHTDFETNVTGTRNILEASKRASVRRFLYAASASCYGIAQQLPTPENAPISPQDPVALTKYLGEQLTMHWGRIVGLPVVSLRLFSVFGPRIRSNDAFSIFLSQKLHRKPFTVTGDGTQTRDFVYVSDVVEAFYAAALSDAVGEVFNVGSSGHYSVNRLVELLQGPVIHISKPAGDPDCTFADVSKIQFRLGWRAKVSFAEGVRRLLDQIELFRDASLSHL